MNLISRHFQLTAQRGAFELRRGSRLTTMPKANQVLVRMGAASLNYRDLLTLQDPSVNRDGLIPLSDGAGTVMAVGAGVTRWKAGDRVSVNFFPTWLRGAFAPSALATALGGGETDGMLSDYVVADTNSLVPIPEHLSLAEAATLPCAAVTAWHALFERGQLQPGETVLVQGTGGVALFGLQLAAAHGAKVIVTSSSEEKLARAKALGAWKTINYDLQPAWDKAAMDFTEGRGVDHILELGGPQTYDKSIAAVAPGGRIAQIGVLTGFASQPNILPLQFKNASIHGICVGSVEHFEHLNQFMSMHRIHPVIDTAFAFDDVPAAYAHLQSAGHFGKLVVNLN
ncbi:MAG: NAD(P)-dependent alcohol dehydrogenase [Pelomonas sp.]|nr:NAD(P)-dependent alcohol dehydrogenase [Roseateles sp.]